MSLLMKALKKAEESQQGHSAGDEPTLSELAEELSLEPVPERAAPGQGKTAEQKIAETPAPDVTQHSAANLFAAKEQPEGGRHSRMVVMLAIGALLFLVGGGAYLYVAINKPGLLLSLKRSPPVPAAVAPALPVASQAPQPAVEIEPPAPVAEVLPGQAALAGRVWNEAAPARSAAEPAKAPVVAEPAPADGAVKVLHGKPEEVSPDLTQAWQALQDGRLETARGLYQRLLQQEPRNVDALLGMAAVMARSNAPGEAGRFYLRALDVEPKNAFAQAGLVSVLGGADPAGSEARLRQLLAEQPAAFLHFALGNLYAARGRWSEAQQAYFDACRLEPDNPDYAFNLAVSLEQISQPGPALTYYRRALALQQKRGAGFERAAVEARIAHLQGMGE